MRIGIQTWGSDGDIRPFIALASGLSSSGHEVTLVLTSVDNKDYHHFGQSQSFKLQQVGNIKYDTETQFRLAHKIGNEKNPLKQFDLILENYFEPVVDEMFSASKKLYEENNAVIGHFIHHPLKTAADIANRPLITVTLNHIAIPTRYKPPPSFPNLGTLINFLLWKISMIIVNKRLIPSINRLRLSEGIKPVKSFREVWESKLLNLIAVSPVFCRQYPDWENYHHICGFLNMPEKGEEYVIPQDLEDFLTSGPAPVYITFGSMLSPLMGNEYLIETTRLMVDATKLAGCKAIIQSYWDNINSIEEHSDIYRITKVPHQIIFPHCSAVVHHCGAGTTQSVTRAGCPSVAVAHMADQVFWGNKLKQLGIAPKPLYRQSITAQSLAKEIMFVLDSQNMKKKAEELGKLLRKEEGVFHAVKTIEETLSGKLFQ